MVHRAPITKHTLAAKLRCLSDKEVVKSRIEGTCDIPTDLNNTTKLILEEIGRIGRKIRNKEGQELIITPEDFIWFWKRVGEFTSSSPPGIHYSHYKAPTKCKLSSKLHAQQLTIIAWIGICHKRWNVSLQLLLENIDGVCLFEKQRYIQLYKADFNFFQQLIFGKEAMENSSKKGSTAEDVKFDKTLTEDLLRQDRHTLVVVSVDAIQCYARVNHVIMALV